MNTSEIGIKRPVSNEKLGGIVLMRHGEGEHNTASVYSSNPNNPGYKPARLTELGRQQVRQSAKALKAMGLDKKTVCRVIVSPLPRTLETAEILMDVLKLPAACREIDSRAIEVDVGERDGQCYREYNDKDFWFPENPERFGGESREQVQARVIDLVESLLNDQQWDLEHQFVVIVSHGVPLLLIQEYLGGGNKRLETAEFKIISVSSHV